MSRNQLLMCVLPALMLSGPVTASDAVSLAPDSVEVTIYRDSNKEYGDESALNGLAMITETRTVELQAGRSRIEFRGVAESIVPQTAKLESLPGQIIENNFDYNVIAPGNLLANSIGKTVHLIRTDFRTGKVSEHAAILRSGPQGTVIEVDGKIEPLNCGGLIERLVFDDSTTLAAKPTLSVNVVTRTTGRYSLRLSYLAVGMNWSADYVANIHPDGKALDLSAWITLSNHLGTSFTNAPVQVVAGDLSRVDGATTPQDITPPGEDSRCWPTGDFSTRYRALERFQPFPADMAKQKGIARATSLDEISVTGSRILAKASNLGDYKLYSLPERTTVAAQQTKQVRFLDQSNVRFERVYIYRVDESTLDADHPIDAPTTTLRMQNKKAEGLGKPLPSGIVAVMESANKSALLTGEHRIDDIPIGSPMDIEIGRAMNVWLQSLVISDERIDDDKEHGTRRQIEVRLANNKSLAIKLEVRHQLNTQAWRVAAESKSHVTKFGQPQWIYTLKPGERAVLNYTVEEVY